MKKIFAIIIFGILVTVTAVPLIANAQAFKMQDCCKLKADVRIEKGNVDPWHKCVKNEQGNNHPSKDCTKEDPCIFKKGCTLGEKKNVSLCGLEGKGGTGKTTVDAGTEMWGLVCLVSAATNIANWIFYLMMVGVILMIVIGGAMYMLSAGNPERANKGKSIIMYSVIGLIIALVARLITPVVKFIVGMV